MKRILLMASLFLFQGLGLAQVAIGKDSVDGDGLLDFDSSATNKLAIILPKVTVLTAQEGSLVFDALENKVKYYSDSWKELSTELGSSDLSDQGIYLDTGAEGMIIGSDSTTAEGVVILESTDKALILPKVTSPEANVISPEPGTICYDMATDLFSVFNGEVWTYWGVEVAK